MTAILRLGGSFATSDCSASNSPPANWPLSRNAVVSGLAILTRVTVAACIGAAVHEIPTVHMAASTAARRLRRDHARPPTGAARQEARRGAVITRSSVCADLMA